MPPTAAPLMPQTVAYRLLQDGGCGLEPQQTNVGLAVMRAVVVWNRRGAFMTLECSTRLWNIPHSLAIGDEGVCAR
jgi:hypothetical protein